MTALYYRPLLQAERHRSAGAIGLARGPLWFDTVEVLTRGAEPARMSASELPEDVLGRLVAPRSPIAGLDWSRPRIMGILNATPDSFSDGGRHQGNAGIAHGLAMHVAGADIVDIGGESTRPGAAMVSEEEELDRVLPLIVALRREAPELPISVDTRKANVAAATLAAGADLFNDVSALTYDAASAGIAANADKPVCLMHAQGDPATMQKDPHYDDVLLDVFDFLADRVAAAEASGIMRSQIMVDPGIGFGKTAEHNLALLRGLSLFHTLGCPILLGASRKRFIGTIGRAEDADARAPGSIAVALEGVRQGVQMLRVHDVAETVQAVRLWQALI
ncbi:dihydropteroate synthase [Algicella marina]|uniref:Dihydropteroate synthase n=1 Tax=Algicella marina TaxID=2683284 RepID=A0A6P1SY60_9RHOB|nr:dihydropteroate synthase [Algicella marina]QHQ34293.1 dihydropteroate synthase [Algicella marina]